MSRAVLEACATADGAYPEEVIRRVRYWMPGGVPAARAARRVPRAPRIAALLGARLWDALRGEARLLALTPRSWRLTLRHARPDLLLVESCRESAGGHWRFAQAEYGAEHALLREMVAAARSGGVPCAYWMTADRAWHAHYAECARLFDHVFCADEREAEALRGAGVAAHWLPPAVQTARFHPVRDPAECGAARIRLLADGIIDLLRPSSGRALPAELFDLGLELIESHGVVLANRLERAPWPRERLLGCVTPEGRIGALRRAQALVSGAHSHLSVTGQRWRALEAAACGVPQWYLGKLPAGDLRREFTGELPDVAALASALHEIEAGGLQRERLAQHAWRRAGEAHAIGDRLETLCLRLGIDARGFAPPRVSLVMPIEDPARAADCVRICRGQGYADKELIIVCPAPLDTEALRAECGGEVPVQALVPARAEDGRLRLDAALAAASGEFCALMSADDLHGQYYLPDLVQHARALDADLLAKPRLGADPGLCWMPGDALARGAVRLRWHALLGRRDWLRGARPRADLRGGDVVFENAPGPDARIAWADRLNLVARLGRGERPAASEGEVFA